MFIYILGCFVHRLHLRIIKMNASFGMFGPDQISGKSSKCLITKFPKGFIKIVPSINIWVWVFSPLWWQEKKEERKAGREKITFCSIRIWFPSHHSNCCQQSTCDLNIAKSSGHSQSSAYFTFQHYLAPSSLTPQNTFFIKTPPCLGFLPASLVISSWSLCPILIPPKLLMGKCPRAQIYILFSLYSYSLGVVYPQKFIYQYLSTTFKFYLLPRPFSWLRCPDIYISYTWVFHTLLKLDMSIVEFLNQAWKSAHSVATPFLADSKSILPDGQTKSFRFILNFSLTVLPSKYVQNLNGFATSVTCHLVPTTYIF